MTGRHEIIDVNSIPIDYHPVALEAVVSGVPSTGTLELDAFVGNAVGIWEMTEGGMRDIETEEIFVVTGGEAIMVLHHEREVDEMVELRPGTLVRLAEGQRTTWTVTTPLRKVYFLPPASIPSQAWTDLPNVSDSGRDACSESPRIRQREDARPKWHPAWKTFMTKTRLGAVIMVVHGHLRRARHARRS